MRLIEHIDVACYRIDPMSSTPPFFLHLTHLNPVLQELGLTEQEVSAEWPDHLCVPIAKEGLFPPDDILELVKWIDLKKYRVKAEPIRPIPLFLSHLNPLFRDLPGFMIEVLNLEQLAVPVAKNDKFPSEIQ
jgi:hypothetical protein